MQHLVNPQNEDSGDRRAGAAWVKQKHEELRKPSNTTHIGTISGVSGGSIVCLGNMTGNGPWTTNNTPSHSAYTPDSNVSSPTPYSLFGLG